MIDFHVVADKVEARIDAMTAHLKEFGTVDMPQELTAWQTEDMHRKYPETKVEQLRTLDEISATTTIYPRSRTYADTHPNRIYHPAGARKPFLSSMPRLLRSSMMRHPILRPLLFDKLFTRMSELLKGKLTWR